ncbi:MAG: cytochrome b/b6 domain-containing protein [Calditrichaceae bacterium]|nr:cytochrome b/b6 domain-containing protein [Calditrichaceae bacterium]
MKFIPGITIVIFSFFIALSHADELCLDCHADKDLTMFINDSTEVSIFFDQGIFDKSVHSGFSCTDCHEVHEDHPDETRLPKVNCANCHEDVMEEYSQSVHGLTPLKKDVPQGTCVSCHGTHNILSSDDSSSMTHKLNIAKTCGNCHDRPDVLAYLGIRGDGPGLLFHGSVHDQVMRNNPDLNAPSCIDCHDYHLVLTKTNPRSTFSKLNLPKTCGKCHQNALNDYTKSIHWQSVLRGRDESPVCNDCHGEHSIISPEDEDAVTNRLNSASRICNSCHASEVMMKRFGLDHRQFESYSRSYHGLALLRGSPDAATCTSCHEIHAIRGAADSLSSIHSSHLIQTCGQCHKNISAEFAAIEVHPLDQESRNPIAYIIKHFYIWMIILVIGGMLFHNLLILSKHIRDKRKAESAKLRYQRFRPFEVYQHLFMFLSFSTLAITGFALKFPDASWVQLLNYLGLTEYLRSTIHRIAAVIMITISLIQLSYFIFTKKGRKEFLALIPNLEDFIHLWQNFKYFLGISRERPKFGRFDYGEKAEYLALIWGVIIMSTSGFVLWFPEFFMKLFPAWSFETFEIIHYFEAWLATLAILVWHWFFVIFHPEKYPVNLTVLDGKITYEDQKHHHPKEIIINKKNKK